MILTAVPDSVLRAANSEVRKVTSVRLSWTVGGGLVVFGVLAFAVMGIVAQDGAAGRDQFMFTVGWAAHLAAAALLAAVVAAAVLGAVAAGAEYRYRSLPVTAMFTPDRNLLLGSKLAVAAGFSLAIVLVLELLGGAALLLFGRDRVPFGGELFAVFGGVALAAVCWSIIGASLGFILRSPVLAMAAVLGAVVIEPLIWITGRAIGFGGFASILPISATIGAITDGHYAKGAFIAPTPAAMAVLLVWTAASVGAAWWFLTSRDL